MLKRTRTVSAAVALVGGSLLLTGCSGQAATNAASNSASTSGSQGSASSSEGDNRPVVSPSSCSGDDFSIIMAAQPKPKDADADTTAFVLDIKNNSEKACQLGSSVVVTPRALGEDKTIEVPTETEGGPGNNITLAPHQTAFAGVKAKTSDKSDPDAKVASGFVTAPKNVRGTVENQVKDTNGGNKPLELPIKSLKIGNLERTPTDIKI